MDATPTWTAEDDARLVDSQRTADELRSKLRAVNAKISADLSQFVSETAKAHEYSYQEMGAFIFEHRDAIRAILKRNES